jgi:hypothetical protein
VDRVVNEISAERSERLILGTEIQILSFRSFTGSLEPDRSRTARLHCSNIIFQLDGLKKSEVL